MRRFFARITGPAAVRVAVCFAVSFAVHVTANDAIAQAPKKEVRSDSLINAALARAGEGDTSQALDLLERANKLAPNDPETLYWRGLILARTTVLGFRDVPRNMLAWHLLNKAADLDPTNSRYLVEMGRIRLKTPLLRLEADRLFRKALAVAEKNGDPIQIAEVAYELGLNKERLYRTTKDRYMTTDPGTRFDWDDALHRLHYTREFIEQQSHPVPNSGFVDRSEAEELYRRALLANGFHERSAMGLMGLLYDQQRYREMAGVAQTFIVAGSGSARIRMAAGLAAYRLGKTADAEKLFNAAIDQYPPLERNDLLSVNRIVRANDADKYDALSANDRMHTDSAYWEAADPILATPENEARIEFLARVAYSDLSFTDAEFRQIGWQTDRGMIILRHGEPPVVMSLESDGRVTTVWFYPKREIQYVFNGPPAMNYSRFAGDMRGYAEQMREDHPFMVDNVAFAAAVDSVPMQLARFRGDKPGTAKLVVAAKVNVPKLYSGVEIDHSALEVSLRLGQPSRMKLAIADTVKVSLPATAMLTQSWLREVPSGTSYRVRVEAFDRAIRTASGRGQNELMVDNVRSTALALSDLLIAKKSSAPDGAISGLTDPSLVPRSDVTLDPGEVFTVYWENYGLKADAQDRISMDVRVQVTLLQIDRSQQNNLQFMLMNVADAIGVTAEGNQTLAVKFHRDETLRGRDRVPQIMSLGLGSSPAGTYKLEFFVTDKVSGTTARTERIIHKGLK